MPSIAIQEAFVAISAATTGGVLTVTATDYLFPGALAWVVKDDGSARARVKIIARLSSTTVLVRRFINDNENGPPNYGSSDMSAFNGSSHICQEPQTAPVDPAYSVRVVG
jgi:hypothetical protein